MVTQTANYISHIVVDGAAIGMVTFNNGAFIDSQLITVKSEQDRQDLLDALPRDTAYETCIGCGLRKGVDVS